MNNNNNKEPVEVKAGSQTNTNVIRPPLYQGGSGLSTKKTGEEGLKLPKVITTSTNSNFNGTNGSLPNIGTAKGTGDTPYKKSIN